MKLARLDRAAPSAPRRFRRRRIAVPAAEPRRPAAAPDPRFRRAAWEAWQQGDDSAAGELLRLEPRWLRYGFRLLAGVLAACGLLVVFGRVEERAAGPLLVRLDQRLELTSPLSGTVAEVACRPGQAVAADQVLLRLWDVDEAAELALIDGERRSQILARLRRPGDAAVQAATAAALEGIAARRQFALTRLAARAIRAPRAGRVGDLRVREGQAVEPGRVLLSLAAGGAEPSLIALLPGARRPELREGAILRATFDGFPYAAVELTIAEVGGEVLSAAEARRLLPAGGAEGLELTEPMVRVRALLPGATFLAEGRRLEIFDGMRGRAEVVLRERRAIEALFPPLGALREAAGRLGLGDASTAATERP